MSYTDTFGGSPVQPARVSLRQVALSTNTTLNWPSSLTDTDDVVAFVMEVTPSTTSLSLTMPDATQAAVGTDTLFRNLGVNTFNVLKSDGTLILSVGSGQAQYVYLRDNSTSAGTWASVQFGTGTSAADAAALAGLGIVAANGLLNTAHPVTEYNSTSTVGTNDRAQTLKWTGGVGTFNFTAASTLGNNWYTLVVNQGSGILTLDPNSSETIDGESTKSINPGESCFVISDGTNLITLGYGREVSSTVSRLSKSVAGSTDVTLTASECENQVLDFTGALTGNINVIVTTTVNIYYVFNNTSGAYTLTVKTAAGTGIAVTQGNRTILECDGTNVVDPQSGTSGTVTSITAGTGLSGGTITGSGTIALANTAATPGAYNAINGTVDAQGRLTSTGETMANNLLQYQT